MLQISTCWHVVSVAHQHVVARGMCCTSARVGICCTSIHVAHRHMFCVRTFCRGGTWHMLHISTCWYVACVASQQVLARVAHQHVVVHGICCRSACVGAWHMLHISTCWHMVCIAHQHVVARGMCCTSAGGST